MDIFLTLSWKCLHMVTVSRRILSSSSTSSRNLLATISRASSGHAYKPEHKLRNSIFLEMTNLQFALPGQKFSA